MTETQPARETVLEARDVCKTFGRDGAAVRAVDHVDFTLARGSSLGIIGESGSGKTTLSRILLGLERADSGQVLLNGAARAPLKGRSKEARLKAAREMQIVFQDPSLSLDPREDLTTGLERILKLHYELSPAARAARIASLIDAVNLTERQARSEPWELSGGQRQRVAIARALSVQPEVLILDEAVSALDVSVQAQILNLLNDLRAEFELSYVFVSHDLSVVRYVTEHSIVMRRGDVVEDGPTGTLLAEPQHPYTKLLLASVPRQDWQPEEVRELRRELEQSEAAQVEPAA